LKKIIAALLVLALVLAAAPWGMGRIAQSRIDKGLASMVRKAGYIRIVESRWSGGWFHSGQLVTFEIVPPNAPRDAPAEPIRVSLRNELLHGPVLGSSGIGLARLDSSFVLGEEIRRKLIDLIRTDEPVQVVTRLGFLGGATTKVTGEARSIALGKLMPEQIGTIEWDAFQLTLELARGAKSYEIHGRMPRVEARSENSGAHALFTDLRVDGKGNRITEDLYDGGGRIVVGRMLIEANRRQSVEIEKFEYGVAGSRQGDFMDFTLTTGSGAVMSARTEEVDLQLAEANFDITAGHLHIATLQQLITALRETNAKIVDGSAAPEATLETLRDQGVALVKHDPQLSIERINIVTPAGEALIKGWLKLQGVTDKDLETGVRALPQKLVADITIEVAEKLVEKFPSGAALAKAAIDVGYFTREGAKLVSHIELRQGALQVNGKASELPDSLRLPGVPAEIPAQ
jgi:uncharacterized protein YdgA (DUF945 family)